MRCARIPFGVVLPSEGLRTAAWSIDLKSTDSVFIACGTFELFTRLGGCT